MAAPKTDPQHLIFRAVSAAEIAACCALTDQQRAQEFDLHWSAAQWGESFAMQDWVCGAFRGAHLLACVLARVLPVDIFDAELLLLQVAPAERRQGIASQLLSHLQTLATNMGKQRILLEVDGRNLAALHLYERHGFACIAERRNYYGRNTSAKVLAQQLKKIPSPNPPELIALSREKATA